MKNYNKFLRHIKNYGVDRVGRNATTRALFSQQLRFDLNEGFPAVTTKKLAFKSVLGELLWFIEGSSDDARLREIMGYPADKDTIWTANAHASYWQDRGLAKDQNDLGRIYSKQYRSWTGPDGKEIDQLARVIEQIKKDPNDRRLIVTAWNPGELDKMALPPCHVMYQFFVANGKLSCHMLQRSCDMFLGVPFNIASYALLTHMVAQVCKLGVGELVITLVDAHIYHEHFEAVDVQLGREVFPLPKLVVNPDVSSIDGFKMDDFRLDGYLYHPSIKAAMIA